MTMLQQLERIVRSEFAGSVGRRALDPDEDLLGQGVIDSLGIIKLIVALEEAFNITVGDEEVVPENFQTLNSMASYVEGKVQK
jgi:acyl carrier protein